MQGLKCSVVMLPHQKQGDIYPLDIRAAERTVFKDNKNKLITGLPFVYIDQPLIPQHLYLVSTREITEGNWICDSINIARTGYDNVGHISSRPWRKIEATTDPSLNLPLIPQSFVEKYVEKQGQIGEVLLESYYSVMMGYNPLLSSERVKVRAQDRTVIIHKVKDSWNREEVAALCIAAIEYGENDKAPSTTQWLEKNLD